MAGDFKIAIEGSIGNSRDWLLGKAEPVLLNARTPIVSSLSKQMVLADRFKRALAGPYNR